MKPVRTPLVPLKAESRTILGGTGIAKDHSPVNVRKARETCPRDPAAGGFHALHRASDPTKRSDFIGATRPTISFTPSPTAGYFPFKSDDGGRDPDAGLRRDRAHP